MRLQHQMQLVPVPLQKKKFFKKRRIWNQHVYIKIGKKNYNLQHIYDGSKIP